MYKANTGPVVNSAKPERFKLQGFHGHYVNPLQFPAEKKTHITSLLHNRWKKPLWMVVNGILPVVLGATRIRLWHTTCILVGHQCISCSFQFPYCFTPQIAGIKLYVSYIKSSSKGWDQLYIDWIEMPTVSIYYLAKPQPRWRYLIEIPTVSIYYLVKPIPLSLSTIWWNQSHCLYLLSGETNPTVSIYYLVKPIPLSLSTIWWNQSHCLYLVKPFPLSLIYYLMKPIPLSLSILSGETNPTVSIYYLVKPLPLSLSTI